jgi:hypothetical protein
MLEGWISLGPAARYMVSMSITPGPNNVMLTAACMFFIFS